MNIRYRHTIPEAEAKAAFGAMVELLNQSRIAEAVPHARRLREMGLPQHPQLGRSKAAREAEAAERDRVSGFPKSADLLDLAPSKSEPQAASTPLAARNHPQ